MRFSEVTPGLEKLDSITTQWRPAGRTAPWFNRHAFRICLGLSLLLILLVYFDFSAIVENLRSIEPGFVFLAITILTLQFLLALTRWVFVLRTQGIPVTFKQSLSIYGIGALANLVLVTSIAGMSVRTALLVRTHTSISAALASVAAERIAAILGLSLAGAFGAVFAFPYFKAYLNLFEFPAYLELAAIAGLVVLVSAAIMALRRFEVIRKFAGQIGLAFSSASTVLLLAGVSVGIVLLGFSGVAILAHGMKLDIDALFFVSVMPAVVLVTSLPISIGGWGVREGAMVAGLALFSIPGEAAVALSISYGLTGLLVTVVLGGLLAFLTMFNRVEPGKEQAGAKDNLLIR